MPTLDELVQGLFDPDIVERASILPFGRNTQGETEFAAPQAVLELAKALMGPGHAFRGGEITERDVTDIAMALGGSGGVASLAAPSPAGSLGIFAGRRAKTANQDTLRQAEGMAAEGIDRGDIWRDTGWYQGADDKWRFEIDDSQMAVKNLAPGEQVRAEGVAGDYSAIQHPELAQAYPELQEIDHLLAAEGSGGSFMGRRSRGAQFDPAQLVAQGKTADALRSTTLHELQHGAQGQEGFAAGGGPEQYARGPMFDRKATDLNADLSQEIYGTMAMRPDDVFKDIQYADPQAIQSIAERHGFRDVGDAVAFLKAEDIKRTPFDQYRRLAGEAESRNVQARRDFTPEQRRATAPWETLDVPESEMIVRMLREGI